MLAVGVGAVSPRRGPRPFAPAGYRLGGTPAEVALDLSVPLCAILAVTASLPAWGHNNDGEQVWSVAAVKRALGWPEPDRSRGAPWRGRPIVGTRGTKARRGRLEPAALSGDLDAAGGPQEPQSGRGWAFDEEG
jgi:hypothetical protein